MGRRKGLTFYQRKKKLNMVLIKEIASWIFWMFVSAFLAIVLVFCMGMKTNVIGSSMEPCLYNGQEIFLNRVIYRLSSPKIGDVVVFRPNGNEKAHYYVKRVLAIPGDTVQVKGGILYVNGETQEDYFNDKIAEPGIAENLIELGEDEYFLLGDNRNNSKDSRNVELGIVKREQMEGKVFVRIYPFAKIGKIK